MECNSNHYFLVYQKVKEYFDKFPQKLTVTLDQNSSVSNKWEVKVMSNDKEVGKCIKVRYGQAIVKMKSGKPLFVPLS